MILDCKKGDVEERHAMPHIVCETWFTARRLKISGVTYRRIAGHGLQWSSWYGVVEGSHIW